ncbi:spore coat protein [Candidatus Methylomirabilis lanthanidiphila]|uniref:Spore coat protein n=1 Tax=Candidatus Methylomirabilis lanthanidiphila TaxID=2211376 RepID=A0A564ZIY3_9BACT|nr:DegT/DnrJ/EryC1/StrS aminotransferase family protein [Candidatus Methylomirabilis lanthanidiphila]VUZ84498.1 spore coat protein [Candidatus Methylomirabilis lanthanidiphila]
MNTEDGRYQRIPFHLPSIGEEEIAEVVETLRSGWLTTGPKVRRFEEMFAAYVGARHAIAVNSGTAALHLALEAVGIGPGDEVILPTYTFAATGEVVAYLGAHPVLTDCRPDTFNIDVTTIEPLITPKTKAIIPVHIAGQPCDMDPIMELAKARGLHVIEDAAHALPATYKGKMVGTISDLTAFSFYATKPITTGEGGMVTTERDDYASRIKRMSLHGLSGDAWNRYSDKGHWYYEILDFGFKYNLTDLAAALGIQQLRRSDDLYKRRREIARMYNEGFSGVEACVIPQEADYGTHAWHLYILQLNLATLAGGRNEVIRSLGEHGIGTSVHFIPLHLHPVYQKRCGYSWGAFPVSERIFERAISLPIYPGMTDADVGRVIESVRNTLHALRR